MGKLVITGIGPLTPVGTGRAAFRDSVSRGACGIDGIKKFSSVPGARGGEVPEADADDRKFRRAAEISKNAMNAVRGALKDADITSLEGEESALVFGITHGAINYSLEYHSALLERDGDVSPLLFSDSVLNAPAGNGSIRFGVKGAVHTVVGDITASIKAVMLACRLLKSGSVSRSVVVSAEEINELIYYCRSGLKEPLLSEGAGAIIIEHDNVTPRPEPYCAITGYGSYFDAANPGDSFERAAEKALRMAGMEKDKIDFAFVDGSTDRASRYLKDVPSGSTARNAGNAFSVTAAWNIILAAIIIKDGVIPGAIIEGKASGDLIALDKGNILVCNSEVNGASSALVLSKC